MGILKLQGGVTAAGAHEGVAGIAKLIHRIYHSKDDIQTAVLAQGQERSTSSSPQSNKPTKATVDRL